MIKEEAICKDIIKNMFFIVIFSFFFTRTPLSLLPLTIKIWYGIPELKRRTLR